MNWSEVRLDERGTTRFLHDGDALVAEYDAAGTMTARYVHGTGAGDDPLAWYDGDTLADRRHLFSDHQGSINAVTDAAGNALWINWLVTPTGLEPVFSP